MGVSGIGFWELLLVLVVVLLLFGSKRLPGIATDLGTAIRDLRRTFSGDPPGLDSPRDAPRDSEDRGREDAPGPDRPA